MSTFQPNAPIRFHRFALSGHSHRVELFLNLLGLRFEGIDIDMPGGAHKAPGFLALNCFGQVPVIEDGDVVLADSNAILVYLAQRYDDGKWLPREPAQAAEVQRWLSIAAGPVAFGPAAARLVTVFKRDFDHDWVKARAHDLFATLDRHLAGRRFLTGDTATIADIANYSYIAHAPEGGVSLEPYANIRAWLQQVEALPGFVPMPQTKAGLLAA